MTRPQLLGSRLVPIYQGIVSVTIKTHLIAEAGSCQGLLVVIFLQI